jgi:hypothetical protein
MTASNPKMVPRARFAKAGLVALATAGLLAVHEELFYVMKCEIFRSPKKWLKGRSQQFAASNLFS